VKISQTYGPDPVLRYNGYPAARLHRRGNPAMLSSAQAMATMAARQAGAAQRHDHRMDRPQASRKPARATLPC